MNQTPVEAACLHNVLSPYAQYIFNDIVWYVCTRIESLVTEYRETPKSQTSKKTEYRTSKEVRTFYRLLLDIGQPVRKDEGTGWASA